MWLYIPSSCLQESGCSERGQEPHSSILESNCEPFATWSGKPLLLRSLSRLWKRESLIQRLSGLTLPLSEASSSVERWIASLPGSHARTSLLPVSAQALMESAPDFSFTSSTSPRIAMRGSSFWRTSVASLLPPPPLWIKLPPPTLLESATDHQKTIHTEKMALYLKEQPPGSWESWPIAGGVRNGSLYQRPTWAPATGVNDGFVSRGGNWGAPTAHDARRPGADVHSTQGANLNRQAALWMTPSVSNSQGNEYTRDRGQKGQERLTLTGQAAQWPTPAARDSKGANSADHALVTGGGQEAHGSTSELCGALPLFAPGPEDPIWGDIIEQFPWLSPATEPGVRLLADGMALLVDESRSHQIREVGNGVVPLQAAAAIVTLVRRAGIMNSIITSTRQREAA